MMSPAMSPISAALIAMILILGAHTHMIMNTPIPYNFDIAPYLQVDPVAGNTHPFPCHNQYAFTSRTSIEAGASTLVNFTGGSQHGGGSCQFSISYDEPVHGGDWNKSATFKTIYSIVGGCPGVFTNEDVNLPVEGMDMDMRKDSKHCGNDYGINCIRQFHVPIPGFLKNGPATFAWTWFNKVGNKEMYMNCAPVSITGGTGDQEQIDLLPDIFVANYPNDPTVPNCVTGTAEDKVVLNFPEPGNFGRIAQAPLEPFYKPLNYCDEIPPPFLLPTFLPDSAEIESTSTTLTTTSSPLSDDDEPTMDSILPGPTSEPTDITPVSSPPEVDSIIEPTSTVESAHNGGAAVVVVTTTVPSTTVITTVTATGAPPNTSTDTTNSTTAVPTVTPLGPGPVVSPAPAMPSLSPAVGAQPGKNAVACEINGQMVCFEEGKKSGLCDFGWAVPQDVAEGTVCYWGRIVDVVDGGLAQGQAY